MIHILDATNASIVAFLESEALNYAIHSRNLNLEEKLDFHFPVSNEKSEYLGEKRRAIIQDEKSNNYREFIIDEVKKIRRTNVVEVYCSPSFLELKKQKIIEPKTYTGQTVRSIGNVVLDGTNWAIGKVETVDIQQVTFEDYTNPFEALRTMASKFDMELNFRIEISGNKVIGRYVDFVEQIGNFRGKEIEFAKDLQNLIRTEKTDKIVTSLFCLGAEKDDGTRLTVTVEDEEARQRWGWGFNKEHLIEVYEPQSGNQDMTLEELTNLGNEELKKRINAVVDWEIDFANLDNIEGLDHEKTFIGDSIRVKDIYFNPPLYASARVQSVEKSLLNDKQKSIKLSDVIEYTQDEIMAEFKNWRNSVLNKAEIYTRNFTYNRDTIDQKDSDVEESVKDDIANGNVTLPTTALEGAIELATTTLNNADSTVFTDQYGNFYFINPYNNNLVVKITSEGIGVSESGISGPFRTAMTGSGIVADLITTGTLNAELVNIIGADGYISMSGNQFKATDRYDPYKYVLIQPGNLYLSRGVVTIERPDGYTTILDGVPQNDFSIIGCTPPFTDDNVSIISKYFQVEGQTERNLDFFSFKHDARYLKITHGVFTGTSGANATLRVYGTGYTGLLAEFNTTESNPESDAATNGRTITIDLGDPTGGQTGVYVRLSSGHPYGTANARIIRMWKEG